MSLLLIHQTASSLQTGRLFKSLAPIGPFFTAESFRPPACGISLWTELRLVAAWHMTTGALLYPPPKTRFSFFFCSYWEVRLFFFLATCFLSRWESAGFLKVPWCKILQSIFAVASKNCQKHSYSFISSVFYLKMKVSKSLPSVARWWNRLPRFTHVLFFIVFSIVSLFLLLIFLSLGCQHLFWFSSCNDRENSCCS